MSGIVVKKEPTTRKTLDTAVSRDKNLSYKARGIMFYLLSKPDDWNCQLFDLVKNSDKDGLRAVQSAMKELVKFGYAKLKRHKNDQKDFTGSYYEIYEKPQI